MASAELQRLWKLAQTDLRLLEIRKRAAALDVGSRIQAEIQALETQEAEVGGRARALQQEQTDLELKQKGAADKRKRFEKDLYGGKVVNPREVENIEREIAALKRQEGSFDERLLELFDLVPPAKAEAEKIQAKIEERKKALAERRKQALAEKGQLEEAFKEASGRRPELSKDLPTLLARYEDIRKRHNGIGMVEMDKRTGSCGGCGTRLPERTIQALKDEKVATCETCHRILYYTEGLV